MTTDATKINEAQAAFEKWSDKYDHYSSEYLDMGADRFFVAGYQAALESAAILELCAEVRALRDRLEIDPSHPYDGIYCRDETIRLQGDVIDGLRDDLRALREDPSDDAVLCALVAWFSVSHPDQEDFRARMRKAIDAARGTK
jgi:hypothetical protein